MSADGDVCALLTRGSGQTPHQLSDNLLWEKPDRDTTLTPRAQQAHLNAWMRVLDKDEPDYKD